MVFFRGLRQMRGPLVRGDSTGERLTRLLLLVTVFVICALLFQWNTQRHLDRLKAKETIHDATGTLTADQKDALLQFSRLFKEEFGMEVRVVVTTQPLEPPAPAPSIIYLGLNPDTRQVVLQVPPLAARALGEETLTALRETHFPPYFDDGTWPKGLILALSTIWNILLNQSAAAP
ncbi:MAG: TPM domain-containing protein [Desulfovibrio sp.]|nr:TPM domain-containing protein [Desulfovibrio sp.]MCA1985288.1 TPM domain-containing protein [Desulfovibrio sp.]